VKYACIAQHRDEFTLTLMCRVLEVSASGFHRWRKRSPTARAIANESLMAHIRVAFDRSDATYGAPRIHRELRAQGHHASPNRVARLMRQHGLRAVRPSRWVVTTDSAHAEPVAPNRLARHFAVPELNQVWVSDITYIPTQQGWLYLAIVLDLASRRVVGWAMRSTLATELAVSALQMAIDLRRPGPGVLHHSDRGRQYAAREYQALLAAHAMIPSMSRRGDCWDNAVAESFFSTLEFELVGRRRWRTRDDARHAIFRYIETWYNRERRHSTLDYRSPADFEADLTAA
jgi:transposase InsO family protein